MKRTAIIMTAAIAAGGMSLVPVKADTLPKTLTPQKTVTPTTLPDIKTTDSSIDHLINRATQYAMTPKDMSKLVGLFAETPRHNITKSSSYFDGYGDKLDNTINSISKTWTQKYGHDFAIYKSHDVLSEKFASIQTKSQMESATIDISSANDMAKLYVPVVREKGDWKINVPDTLTAQKLRDNLQTELTAVEKDSAHLPANETDAYRLVSQHVLRALLDQSIPAHAQASAKPVTAQPTAQQAQVKPISATSTTTHHWWQVWDW
jgi:hypothetical protein